MGLGFPYRLLTNQPFGVKNNGSLMDGKKCIFGSLERDSSLSFILWREHDTQLFYLTLFKTEKDE